MKIIHHFFLQTSIVKLESLWNLENCLISWVEDLHLCGKIRQRAGFHWRSLKYSFKYKDKMHAISNTVRVTTAGWIIWVVLHIYCTERKFEFKMTFSPKGLSGVWNFLPIFRLTCSNTYWKSAAILMCGYGVHKTVHLTHTIYIYFRRILFMYFPWATLTTTSCDRIAPGANTPCEHVENGELEPGLNR